MNSDPRVCSYVEYIHRQLMVVILNIGLLKKKFVIKPLPPSYLLTLDHLLTAIFKFDTLKEIAIITS
jgi:hypothetical protein